MDFFVEHIQGYIPTLFLKLVVRLYLYINYYFEINKNLVKNVIYVKETNCNNDVAILTETANKQHYEISTNFFKLHLGDKLKYSSCEWDNCDSLNEAEINTLQKYQHLSKLNEFEKGEILEIGCGWGSLSLFNAEKFPHLNFTCFSNSESQIDFINQEIKDKKLNNLVAFKEDYNVFCSENSRCNLNKYDRIIGIETVEHCLNIESLFYWINKRLNKDGLVFIQSLVTQHNSYLLDNSTWMGRNFFSGGQMLAFQSYFHYNNDLIVKQLIPINGSNYGKTLELWLSNLENLKINIIEKYGKHHYEKFRMFYIQSFEAFNSHNGNNFMIGYYILEKRINN